MLGAAFKPDSDDIRDSPALDVAGTLHEHGRRSSACTTPRRSTTPGARAPARSTSTTCARPLAGADVVLHLTEWREYRELDPAEIGALVAGTKLLEGRNALDVDRWVAAGWDVKALGRPRVGG